jgi:hypothetical protein
MSAVCIDFDTDFASFFEPPLQKVATLSDIDVDSFRRRFRAPGVPLIIEGESENWPALQLWPKLEYLKRKVGQEPVFVRDLDRGNISGVAYREPYLRLPFSEFIDRISGPKPQNLYLTQGIVRRPAGVLRAFERARSPAILTALAGDLPAPRLWRPREVLETNLWLGPGGHGSPLHFDELDNLNAVITGCKRWLLFPSVEVEKLTAGGRDARQSIARGFHAGEPDRFVPPQRRIARGYQCVVRPGQILYVPRGMWHQVFSGPDLSMAVNSWFFRFPQDAHDAALFKARRLVGFRSPRRLAMALTVIYGDSVRRLGRYGAQRLLGKQPALPEVGKTSYI